MVIHASFPDFILFLYVHIAHSDNSYDPKEMAVIKSKVERLFPKGTDIEKKLYKAIREYNAFDHNKISELFRDTFAHFNRDTETTKTKLYADVKAIMDADGKVLSSEKEAFTNIKRIVEFS